MSDMSAFEVLIVAPSANRLVRVWQDLRSTCLNTRLPKDRRCHLVEISVTISQHYAICPNLKSLFHHSCAVILNVCLASSTVWRNEDLWPRILAQQQIGTSFLGSCSTKTASSESSEVSETVSLAPACIMEFDVFKVRLYTGSSIAPVSQRAACSAKS